MKRLIIAGAIVLAASLSAEAAAKHHSKHHMAPQTGVTVWDKESRDPNVGWHTVNGDRVCSHDCDNPEIPGSGAVCRNVTVMGMRMHECVTGN